MPKGTVKKIVSDRGFGFIAADDGKEYFFHQSGVDSTLNFDSLRGGEAVSFDIEQSQKGPGEPRPSGLAHKLGFERAPSGAPFSLGSHRCAPIALAGLKIPDQDRFRRRQLLLARLD